MPKSYRPVIDYRDRREMRLLMHERHIIADAQKDAAVIFRWNGIAFAPNYWTGHGSFDLLVKKGNSLIPIDILLFTKWNQAFLTGRVEREAYSKVGQKMLSIKASTAIIWLPKGKPNFWQKVLPPKRRNIHVVFGNPKNLYGKLLQLSPAQRK